MYDLLVERGYRVDTQVKVGDFRIDLVVEGENDRRVAIECDGDRYHGPDRWASDMNRQRILERAGWTVWKCFASRFVRVQRQVMEELVGFLSERGIQPVGGSDEWTSRHVEQRAWRSSDSTEDDAQDEVDLPSEPVENCEGQADHSSDELATVVPSDDEEQGSARVTEAQVQEQILQLMSDGQVWSNSQLKEALPDHLPLSSADRAPAAFRPHEEKWEELVDNALSPSRSNSLHSRGLVESRGSGLHQLTSSCGKDETQISSDQSRQPHETVYRLPPHEVGQEYQFSELSVPEGDGDLLYEDEYQRRLETIVEEVIEREGPVYLDLVVERVARAHGKQKAGRIIQERVVSAIPTELSRSHDGDRLVLFPKHSIPEMIVPLRPSRSDWRSHRDIPLIELASLALPGIRSKKPAEDVLAHYSKAFKLARLRQPTRVRFEEAIAIARSAVEAED